VFWLRARSGEHVGMAAVIFRSYWIDNRLSYAAVVGDISLDRVWRGRALGQLLLQYMTDYLDEHFPEHPAFVIPTEAARRTLARIGWATPGALIPYVYVVDPTRYVRRVLRSEWIAAGIARVSKRLAQILLRRYVGKGRSLRLTDTLDLSESEWIRTLRGSKAAIAHEAGPAFLFWRYARHPHVHFSTGRLVDDRRALGLLIFELKKAERSCAIYDLISTTPEEMQSMLALFVLQALGSSDLDTIRVLISRDHPARACLRRLGFIPRRAEAVFQVHSRSGVAERSSWWVTSGDKDT
jgi:hypothetical protein